MNVTKLCHIGFLAAALTVPSAFADDQVRDAAIGGGVGGALGGAVGAELGGREGAIVGAAAGAAIGAAVATEKDGTPNHQPERAPVAASHIGHPHGYHCPPGQAKKNRC